MDAMARGKVRVVLADDHDLVRSGIKALLARIGGVEVIAEARNGSELVALVDDLLPDVVMTDLNMPGMDGLAAIAAIRARHPHLPALVLSMNDDVESFRAAVARGASGYLMKDAQAYELAQALRTVLATGSYFSPAIAARLLQPAQAAEAGGELTGRQVEIVKLLAQGKAAKEIAYELGLSRKTVDAHRTRIMERLGVNDIASLTLYAVRKGLVKP